MKKKEVDEILEHISQKFEDDVPSIVKMLVRKKIGKFQSFDSDSLPESLKTCTVQELIDIVQKGDGRAVMSKTGHAFIKERMRKEDAVYGGEMSAHHYFRDFSYCDSGMVPWLLVIDLMSRQDKKLSELVDERIEKFPCSGEINRRIQDAPVLLKELETIYGAGALNVDRTDGLSIEFADWRFNIRSSNTEPVVRLNVETRGDGQLMEQKRDELLDRMGGDPA